MKNAVKNLDLRGMPPFERHTRILDMWNSLKNGETLRITNDHEPKPLYYLFEAEYKNQFEWKYEQRGPKDWVFRIRKIEQKDEGKKQKIKALIKKLHSKSDINSLKKEGKDLLKKISPAELALIEQEIIQEGVTRKEMRRLCDVHLEIMKEGFKKSDISLEKGHPIHTLTEEHKMILGFVDKLKGVTAALRNAKGFDDVTVEIGMLRHIAEHLVEADKHYQREEEVLFPVLEKLGVTEPPEIMREEHEELKPKKAELYRIAQQKERLSYKDFVKKVNAIAGDIIEQLPNHIYKEDNILYPMTLQLIPAKEWAGIKKRCDKIGYCCFTPEH